MRKCSMKKPFKNQEEEPSPQQEETASQCHDQEGLPPGFEEKAPMEGHDRDIISPLIKGEMEALKMQIEQEKKKYFRGLADMENLRKRMHKEKYDATRFATANLINEFLIPIDNLEHALSFARHSEETQDWLQGLIKGLEMTLTEFHNILENHQVIPFQSEGLMFDPHLHEVIEMEETKQHPEGMIIQEFVRGYKHGDRVLRPARVKVAKAIVKDINKKLSEENKQGEN